MELTAKQEEGLKIAVARYNAHEAWTCIAGYAGTGKSTLISYIISALDIPPEEVAYIAFTGKATSVLANKGCSNAITAHKFLYDAYFDKEKEKFCYKPKDSLDDDYSLIVVDEVSMLPLAMWNRLLTHKIHVLACGDPGQLPPIDPTENNHILDKPHIFLDEVMRQAKDSEIIRLSMYIRDGKTLENYQGEKEQVQIFSTKEVQSGMYLWADQILCASNELRTAINNHVRILNGYGEEPVVGDKIISLRNQWDIISNNKIPLINGTIGYIKKSKMLSIYPPRFIYNKPLVCLNVQMKTDEGDMYENIPIDYIYFKTGEPQISQSVISALNKSPYFKHHVPCEFSYGYAITTWKAQGSEWNKVMGFEESFPRDKEEHQKFLYTMITRASKKLVLVKKP